MAEFDVTCFNPGTRMSSEFRVKCMNEGETPLIEQEKLINYIILGEDKNTPDPQDTFSVQNIESISLRRKGNVHYCKFCPYTSERKRFMRFHRESLHKDRIKDTVKGGIDGDLELDLWDSFGTSSDNSLTESCTRTPDVSKSSSESLLYDSYEPAEISGYGYSSEQYCRNTQEDFGNQWLGGKIVNTTCKTAGADKTNEEVLLPANMREHIASINSSSEGNDVSCSCYCFSSDLTPDPSLEESSTEIFSEPIPDLAINSFGKSNKFARILSRLKCTENINSFPEKSKIKPADSRRRRKISAKPQTERVRDCKFSRTLSRLECEKKNRVPEESEVKPFDSKRKKNSTKHIEDRKSANSFSEASNVSDSCNGGLSSDLIIDNSLHKTDRVPASQLKTDRAYNFGQSNKLSRRRSVLKRSTINKSTTERPEVKSVPSKKRRNRSKQQVWLRKSIRVSRKKKCAKRTCACCTAGN